ncbi:MAG: hypothetical protein JWN14_552 [Chthonomonadales bacterium]|nr:hypothetical protein [Chthonomonadales bacterium]
MPYTVYSTEEVGKRGQEIYERILRVQVESQHWGEFLVLDILSETYEIDRDDMMVSDRLLARKPDAMLYGLRIGYPTAYRLGSKTVLPQ